MHMGREELLVFSEENLPHITNKVVVALYYNYYFNPLLHVSQLQCKFPRGRLIIKLYLSDVCRRRPIKVNVRVDSADAVGNDNINVNMHIYFSTYI